MLNMQRSRALRAVIVGFGKCRISTDLRALPPNGQMLTHRSTLKTVMSISPNSLLPAAKPKVSLRFVLYENYAPTRVTPGWKSTLYRHKRSKQLDEKVPSENSAH
jgi:hypothetical protein